MYPLQISGALLEFLISVQILIGLLTYKTPYPKFRLIAIQVWNLKTIS